MSTKKKSSKPFTTPLLSNKKKPICSSNKEELNKSCFGSLKIKKYFNKVSLFFLLIVPVFPTSAQEKPVNCQGEFWSQKSEIIATETAKKEITIPSLWWAKKHYDPFGGKLVSNWLAYPEENRIDLIVDRQLWSSMDYLGRYRFVNQFGMVTRQYGYSLRVVNQQQKCLATYYYDASIYPPKWEIYLDTTGQSSLQLD